MSDVRHFSCPYCNHDTILQQQNYVDDGKHFLIENPIYGLKYLRWIYIVCPNPDCKKYTLVVGFYNLKTGPNGLKVDDLERTWDLIPPSKAKSFPDYIPKLILNDYNEACLIVNLSPKASATLSRRCLQGIIRDFWKVNPGRLVDEIEQLRDKTDPLTWDAIDSVRKVGNIGAHMEKDINLIVDVDPNEAEMLINLIEILLKDWYVAREERKNRLIQIKSIADSKEMDKKSK